MSKIKYVVSGIVLLAIIAIFYFNISLTSLPTTFSKVVNENMDVEGYERVEKIVIGKSWGEELEPPADHDYSEFVIEDEKEIDSLINQELPIYNGGRLGDKENDYYMDVYFADEKRHAYIIGEKYIMNTEMGNEAKTYKVLDDENKIYDYLAALYKAK